MCRFSLSATAAKMQERELHKLSRSRVWMSERDMNVNGIIPMRRGRKEEGNLDSCETERPDNVWGKRMQVFVLKPLLQPPSLPNHLYLFKKRVTRSPQMSVYSRDLSLSLFQFRAHPTLLCSHLHANANTAAQYHIQSLKTAGKWKMALAT